MKFGSLFTGIGGFDLGLELAGWECAWQVEYDKRCNEVLVKHWPNTERGCDVKEWTNPTRVDLICGGFPCQDLSVAGRRAGLAGERSGLWSEFHRILAETQPTWVVIENVPGLLSSHQGRDMGILTGSLAELGYGWAYRVLDAQYHGVAQRRRRVFIVGYLGDGSARLPAKVLFDSTSLSWDSKPSREEGERITGSLTGGAKSSSCGNVDDNRAQAGFVQVSATVTSRWHKGGFTDPANDGVIAFNCQQDPISTTELAPGTSGGADQAVAFAENQRAEVRLMEPHPQLTTGGGKPGQGYPAVLTHRPRRLTPRECERLQGFPDDWTLVNGMKPTPRYKMLGNAVAVPVAQWLGERIAACTP